jgi:hypothetical protein
MASVAQELSQLDNTQKGQSCRRGLRGLRVNGRCWPVADVLAADRRSPLLTLCIHIEECCNAFANDGESDDDGAPKARDAADAFSNLVSENL